MSEPIYQNTIMPTKDENYWQHIYSSQIYGTFFSIYINLLNDGETYENLVSARFHLINYKGPIDIGIKKVSHNLDSKGLNFTITVQGLCEIKESKKVDLSVFNFKEIGLPRINLLRKIAPISESSSMLNGVFDSEFYYRDSLEEPYQYSQQYINYRDSVEKPEKIDSDHDEQTNDHQIIGTKSGGLKDLKTLLEEQLLTPSSALMPLNAEQSIKHIIGIINEHKTNDLFRPKPIEAHDTRRCPRGMGIIPSPPPDWKSFPPR